MSHGPGWVLVGDAGYTKDPITAQFTAGLATLESPPEPVQQLFGALVGDQAGTDRFVSVIAGTVSPETFFDPANIGRIMAGAAPAMGA